MDKTFVKGMIFVLVLLTSRAASGGSLDSDIIEYLFENENYTLFSNPDFEQLEYFSENPINLNKADKADLVQLPGIGLSEASNVLSIAKSSDNINQIVGRAQLNSRQSYLLMNCTTMLPPDMSGFIGGRFESRIRYQNRMNKMRGFEEDKYKGSPLDLYQRYIYSGEKLEGGLLFNKNYGERSLTEMATGYISADYGTSKILAGDYYIESGMGSILWGAFGGRKGAEVYYPALEYGSGIKPFRSTMDFTMFRGLAAEQIFGDESTLTLRGWASSVGRSANIDEKESVATSIYRSSYYRTETEIDKKDKLNETMGGGNIEFSSDNLIIGTNAFYLDYEYPVESSSSAVFRGKSGLLSSVYGYLLFGDMNIGVEAARDGRGNMAYRLGFQDRTEDYRLAMSFRSYSPEFRSPYGANFGEFSYPSNEIGFYAGYEWRAIKDFLQRIYVDIFSTYDRTYYVPEPVGGIDIFSESEFRLVRGGRLIARLRWENKTDYWRNINEDKIIYQKDKGSIRLDWRHRTGKSIRYRLRTEAKGVLLGEGEANESGFLVFAETEWMILENLEIESRATYFTTDSFESAIYQFEYAMPGCMYTVPLYGRGYRFLLGVSYEFLGIFDLSARFAVTHKPGENSMGSGYDRIEGSTDRRLIIQLDALFQ